MPETSPATTTDSAGITRTATGEIAPPSPTTPQTPPTTTSTTSLDPKPTEGEGKTLLTGKEGEDGTKTEAKPAVPEKYDFKAPAAWSEKGWELDTKLIETATPIFKELGLSQDQAQKLVDFYTATSQIGRVNESSTGWIYFENKMLQ